MLDLEIIKIILVCGLIFWLWALVDCIRYESKEWDKILWLCIIVLLNVFGAGTYLLLRFKTNRQSAIPAGKDKTLPPLRDCPDDNPKI